MDKTCSKHQVHIRKKYVDDCLGYSSNSYLVNFLLCITKASDRTAIATIKTTITATHGNSEEGSSGWIYLGYLVPLRHY